MNNGNRKEGEYPFYPVKPEHEVAKTLPCIEVINDDKRQAVFIIDYSGTFQNHFKNVSKFY